MPTTTSNIVKRHNHRVYPCETKRKNELLIHLLTENKDKKIIVATTNDINLVEDIIKDEKITVINDVTLGDSPELKCDLLISYDLPDKADDYIARLSHSNKSALVLLDPKEQKKLYPIEMLLGRTIMQDTVSGFELLSEDDMETKKSHNNKDSKNTWAKKEKKVSKYIGKDENGKAMFSDKTRDRNHCYDGKPRDEAEKRANPKRKNIRKINIKPKKPE